MVNSIGMDVGVLITCIGLILTIIWRTRSTFNKELDKKADKEMVEKMMLQHQERNRERAESIEKQLSEVNRKLDMITEKLIPDRCSNRQLNQ